MSSPRVPWNKPPVLVAAFVVLGVLGAGTGALFGAAQEAHGAVRGVLFGAFCLAVVVSLVLFGWLLLAVLERTFRLAGVSDEAAMRRIARATTRGTAPEEPADDAPALAYIARRRRYARIAIWAFPPFLALMAFNAVFRAAHGGTASWLFWACSAVLAAMAVGIPIAHWRELRSLSRSETAIRARG
ncbi:hypothetical protein [Actinomadura parmotrematis]|uniref:Uncharacterized protein n=1 Tax=Actinomadura parmotrematis TaxID=2864039 RepID=A0ABS7FMT0_9ACTN|nr:hypothetical protein [Actinomadura parmotrematis]MBW8481631.1 hypothetical protein [Actinomadura parmotrematis]